MYISSKGTFRKLPEPATAPPIRVNIAADASGEFHEEKFFDDMSELLCEAGVYDDIQKDLMKVSDLTIGPVSTYFVVVNMGSQSPRGLMLEHRANSNVSDGFYFNASGDRPYSFMNTGDTFRTPRYNYDWVTGESIVSLRNKGDFIEAGLILTRGPIVVETTATGGDIKATTSNSSSGFALLTLQKQDMGEND